MVAEAVELELTLEKGTGTNGKGHSREVVGCLALSFRGERAPWRTCASVAPRHINKDAGLGDRV